MKYALFTMDINDLKQIGLDKSVSSSYADIQEARIQKIGLRKEHVNDKFKVSK